MRLREELAEGFDALYSALYALRPDCDRRLYRRVEDAVEALKATCEALAAEAESQREPRPLPETAAPE